MYMFNCLLAALMLSLTSETKDGHELQKQDEALYSAYLSDSDTIDINSVSGVYRGSMPAADCPGIEVKLTLKKDGKYECVNKYIERGEYVENGTYSIDGDVLVMLAENLRDSSFYRINRRDLIMLDRNRQEIDSPFAYMYVLRKLDFAYHVKTGDIVFDVEVADDLMTVFTQGLTESNASQYYDVTDYYVSCAGIYDLNGDGWPELLVSLVSYGSGEYGMLAGYSVNDGKSLSGIAYSEVAECSSISDGYMGHDFMRIEDSQFVNCFPIYKPGDPNVAPSGGLRKVTYKMVDGECGPSLVIDSVEDFE